ncbi:CCA tRNA nucleotidyltransferase [Cyanobacterium aponinum]|uniref:CCA tRNA nucleotidyltransferase n=1 Tax=Cyanobacterium aponinum 0216 TaxID=2676140 RepID=A0A844GTS0_9CHRO|nr:CCA tRNA nucleotidyltransferase [Cyanobacterium aponinum]MTF38188.1 CCA tRNA nucleotidyltransferase [Cyanobacterium aponinum 0216]
MILHNFLKQNLPFDVNLLPDNCYLVGGAVRDILLKRSRSYLDLDFVLPHKPIETAKIIAREYQAGFVVLDPVRYIARVVFPHATIDFAGQEGDSIYQDLARRDYTINAIAFHCREGVIIDPFQGEIDIKKGILKMISRDNLADDPLRLMRGYRQASQLDFTIESFTRATIKDLKELLKNVAMERVNQELAYLFETKKGSYWLKEAFKDGLLDLCFPSADEKMVNLLANIDESAQFLSSKYRSNFPDNYSWYKEAKLACLTNQNPSIAETELINLKYSRQEIKSVLTILQFTNNLTEIDFQKNKRKQYFFFQSVGDYFPNLAVFALAHNVSKDLILQLMELYQNPEDAIAHPQPLLSGKDIMKYLNIAPSPLIGKILTEIQIAYIEGKINNKETAIDFIKNNFTI